MIHDQIVSCILSALISAIISGLVVYYLHKWIDAKLSENEKQKADKESTRKQQVITEMQRRRTGGRLLYWLYQNAKGTGNTIALDRAMEDFTKAEDEQKKLEQEILATFSNNSV